MLDLMLEKESIGLMVSGSPLRQKEREIAEKNLKNLASLDNIAGEARVAAIIANVKPIVTKKGSKMAFVSLYDEERAVEMTMFADGYDISYPALKEGNPVAVTCRKDNYRGSGFVAIKIEVI